MERNAGLEPVLPAWKAGMLAIEHQFRMVEGDIFKQRLLPLPLSRLLVTSSSWSGNNIILLNEPIFGTP